MDLNALWFVEVNAVQGRYAHLARTRLQRNVLERDTFLNPDAFTPWVKSAVPLPKRAYW